jgi:hypothetical protein
MFGVAPELLVFRFDGMIQSSIGLIHLLLWTLGFRVRVRLWVRLFMLLYIPSRLMVFDESGPFYFLLIE